MSRLLPVTVLISWDMWESENVVSGCQTCCYEPSCLAYYDGDTTFGDEENGKLAEQWIKLAQMVVCLSRLPGLRALDAVGEPAIFAQRWLIWKEEFEFFVTASKTISDPTQKRALHLHLAGPKLQVVFNNSIPVETRGGAKDYKNAMDCLSQHIKLKKNAPMA